MALLRALHFFVAAPAMTSPKSGIASCCVTRLVLPGRSLCAVVYMPTQRGASNTTSSDTRLSSLLEDRLKARFRTSRSGSGHKYLHLEKLRDFFEVLHARDVLPLADQLQCAGHAGRRRQLCPSGRHSGSLRYLDSLFAGGQRVKTSTDETLAILARSSGAFVVLTRTSATDTHRGRGVGLA
jgi:hypothetical protein